ncbi:MAG TPA: hypothetical protein VNN72_05785 [Polyangiaceae bacterium]|nr:hypothetical protein [Polyangiaceae bacterium]
MGRACTPALGRRRAAFLLSGLVGLGCGGGDYWLGGATENAGAGGPPTQSLGGDWELVGTDPVEIGGGDGPCRIAGNGFGILTTGTFSGDLWIHDCTFTGLGTADTPAIEVFVSDRSSVRIERCTFSASGAIRIGNADATSTRIEDNVVLADSVVALDPSGLSTPAFELVGDSTAPKLFRGNRVYRGRVRLASPNWLAGGDGDADTNLLLGLRAGFSLGAPGLVVRGNYVHPAHLADSGDESALDTEYSVSDALAEHNVLRWGTWVVRGFGGEFRYNAVLDADNLAFVQQPFENTTIHHNVLAMCTPARGNEPIQGGIELVNDRAGGIAIFNNTLDGGGLPARFGGPAISIESGSRLASVRSNVFQHFFFAANNGAAAVRPGPTEGTDPPPDRLDDADYNLFDNDGEIAPHNYGVRVPNRTLRSDAGFGLNDATAGGPVDEQVSAELAEGDACFPFSDDDVRAGRVAVSEMLAAIRARFSPAPTSPVLGHGDPADEPENFIGAIGDGTSGSDRFGRFGR